MIKFARSVSQVRIIYILTTLFLVGLTIYMYLEVKHLTAYTTLLSRSQEVKISTNALASSLLSAEYNKRRYLLTGDTVLLFHKDKAFQTVQYEMVELDCLIKDDHSQHQHLVSLKNSIDQKLESINQVRIDTIAMSKDSMINMFVQSQAQLMNRVQLQMDMINKVEDQLFEQRARLFNKLTVMAPIYIIFLFLGALLILLYSYFKLTRQFEDKEKLHSTLVTQNKDRGALAKELLIVNQELAFQNEEKEKRAAELKTAFDQLAFQSKEKETRSIELFLANKELAFQNREKEKQALELFNTNKELELFLNISSHDLQEPLRKIQMAASRIEDEDFMALSVKGRDYFLKMQEAALSMQALIEDLLVYSRTKTDERTFENYDIGLIIEQVKNELREDIEEKKAVIDVSATCGATIIPFQFHQLMTNLLCNSLKFSIPGQPPVIRITSRVIKGSDSEQKKLVPDIEYCHIKITDNGIGFDPAYNEKIFEVFQRLHGKEVYGGSGMGLAIVKKVVENHEGLIIASGQIDKGATFDIYIPMKIHTQNGK